MTKKIQTLVHDISYQNSQRVTLFLELPIEQQARVFLNLSKHVKKQLLQDLPQENIVSILENLDPDEGTDVLQLFSKKRQKELISQLNERLQKNVSMLLEFDQRTAAGLMSLDYVQVDDSETIEQVVTQVRKHENKTGRLPTILALSNGKLAGHLPGHKLVFAKPSDIASQYLKKIPSIHYLADFDSVLGLFRDNPHQKVVVIGEHKNILGVIYTDDVLQLVQEQQGASLYDFAGVSEEETIYDPISKKVASRYKWLMLNLFTAFLAAMTVQVFKDTISKNVLLAVYMPIVAGMGGNAGTQTLAVMIRSLSTGATSLGTVLNALKNEVVSGMVNGVINGCIIAAIVIFVNKDVIVGLTLGFAMIVNLTVAATFGTIMPVIMKKLGKDPASSATIFITTATDILGFFAFLGLATVLLR